MKAAAYLVVLVALCTRSSTTHLDAMLIGVDGPEAGPESSSRELAENIPWGGKPCKGRLCKPSFLIIGAGKSGTSSLYYYFQDHPQGVALASYYG